VLIIEQMLSDLAVEIHTFTDPHMALEYFRQNSGQVKLLITDYRMPQMSGIEFIRSIREELKETMKIIVISAFEPTEREIHSAQAALSVDEIITKPFGIERMVHAVKELLESL
jgi:DNA-binding response OmpR family regulator